MKCSFCGKELERGTQECPYCHCSIEAEVQVLRPEERDTFDGVTIEQDGNAEGGTRVEYMRTERRAYEQNNGGPQIRVHSFGCGSGILMTLLILGGILAIFFKSITVFLLIQVILLLSEDCRSIPASSLRLIPEVFLQYFLQEFPLYHLKYRSVPCIWHRRRSNKDCLWYYHCC